MSLLYEDGYSIKWHSSISIGTTKIKYILDIYDKIIKNNQTFAINLINNEYNLIRAPLDIHKEIILIINLFIEGKFFERLTTQNIIYIKQKLRHIYLIIKETIRIFSGLNKDHIDYKKFSDVNNFYNIKNNKLLLILDQIFV